MGAKAAAIGSAWQTSNLPATELEWFLQDRREDVEQNIQPALARGQIVVLDRIIFR